MRRGGRADAGRGVATSMLVAGSTRRRVDSVGWKLKSDDERCAAARSREEEMYGKENERGKEEEPQQGGEEERTRTREDKDHDDRASDINSTPAPRKRVARCLSRFGPCGPIHDRPCRAFPAMAHGQPVRLPTPEPTPTPTLPHAAPIRPHRQPVPLLAHRPPCPSSTSPAPRAWLNDPSQTWAITHGS